MVRRCVIAAVDHGLHDFLFAVDQAEESVAVISDGLHGELFTDDGWYARFSRHGFDAD